jgi:O-antigen/teichoic acid export membrane protein
MTILLAFLVNAALNFALALLVAKFLGPDDFGRYALAMAVAIVLNTVFFEWLRLSTTRFSSGQRPADRAGIRATLELAYASTVLGLALAAILAALSGIELGLPTRLMLAATAAGIGMALFDYRAALARAAFLDRAYTRLILVKNIAGFALMAGGAYWLREPALVVAGAALSACAAILLVRGGGADMTALRDAQRRHLKTFAAYAIPLVVANAVYQAIPLLNRAALAATAGFGEAGQFALASDIGLRLFMTLGSGLDLLLFQLAVRQAEAHGREAGERQIARNMAAIFALLLPLAAGFWLVLPSFEALFVPTEYRGAFAAYSNLLIPALLAFALIQYALNPVFQLERRTGPVVLAALAALVINAALVAALPRIMGPLGVAVAQLGGLAVALLLFAALALRVGGVRPPWRDLALAVVATAGMSAALLPLRAIGPPELALPAMTAAGLALYAALGYALDIAGCRALLRARLDRGRPIAAPAE